jgi:hypothetical protein
MNSADSNFWVEFGFGRRLPLACVGSADFRLWPPGDHGFRGPGTPYVRIGQILCNATHLVGYRGVVITGVAKRTKGRPS